ncbi:MAG TPA: hypothetical protein PLX97_02520, partial [Gemmatales bacterium]|nr:hypothetical protein [Gemmatales bacterium]
MIQHRTAICDGCIFHGHQFRPPLGKAKKQVELATPNTERFEQAKAAVQNRVRALLDLPYSKENLYGGMD